MDNINSPSRKRTLPVSDDDDDDSPIPVKDRAVATLMVMPFWERQKTWEFARCLGENRKDALCEQVRDYILVLKDQERGRKKLVVSFEEEHKWRRFSLIQFIMSLTETYELSRRTLHHALYLHDRFEDAHTVTKNQKYVVAIVCFQLSAKMEERECMIPKIQSLRKDLVAGQVFTTELYVEMECLILKFFDYRIMVPTVVDFAEFYLLFIVDPSDMDPIQDWNNNLNSSSGSLVVPVMTRATLVKDTLLGVQRSSNRLVADVVENLDIMLEAEPDDRWSPSLIAAAVCLFVRRRHGYSTWPCQLATATQYDLATVENCLKKYVLDICDPAPPVLERFDANDHLASERTSSKCSAL